MTRKDYESLAAALAFVRRRVADEQRLRTLVSVDVVQGWTEQAISEVLAANNPRFDRERFLAAARGE